MANSPRSPNPLELLRAYCHGDADEEMIRKFELLLQNNPEHPIGQTLRAVCKTSNDLVRQLLRIYPMPNIMEKHGDSNGKKHRK